MTETITPTTDGATSGAATGCKPKRVFVYGASKFTEGIDFNPSLTDQELQESLAPHYDGLGNATMSPPVESGEGENRIITRKFELKFGQKGVIDAGVRGLAAFVQDIVDAPPHILTIWYVLPELNAATLDEQVFMGHALSVADEEAEQEGNAITTLVDKLLA